MSFPLIGVLIKVLHYAETKAWGSHQNVMGDITPLPHFSTVYFYDSHIWWAHLCTLLTVYGGHISMYLVFMEFTFLFQCDDSLSVYLSSAIHISPQNMYILSFVWWKRHLGLLTYCRCYRSVHPQRQHESHQKSNDLRLYKYQCWSIVGVMNGRYVEALSAYKDSLSYSPSDCAVTWVPTRVVISNLKGLYVLWLLRMNEDYPDTFQCVKQKVWVTEDNWKGIIKIFCFEMWML